MNEIYPLERLEYLAKLKGKHSQFVALKQELEAGEGLIASHLATKYNINQVTIKNLAAAIGRPHAIKIGSGMHKSSIEEKQRKMEVRAKLHNIDWSDRDTDIAVKLGVTRERARQLRKAAGKSKSVNHHQVGTTLEFKKWISTFDKSSFVTNSLKEIAELYGNKISPYTVKKVLDSMNIVYRKANKKKPLSNDVISSLTQPGQNGCINWLGERMHNVYPVYIYQTKPIYVRKWLWEQKHGKPDSYQKVVATCGNNLCVNPDHIKAYSSLSEFRSSKRTAQQSEKIILDIFEHYKNGFRVDIIAEKLNTSTGYVYRVIHDAKKYLNQQEILKKKVLATVEANK